ncbi:hypothetical protein BBJ28_00024839 [Nothophytophthora sp. Chile5]|nr:hypothetical protein BBJ28_00024839 [Nothophytophthora sp. Chile5]
MPALSFTRRFQRWQLRVARGDRLALAQGLLPVLLLGLFVWGLLGLRKPPATSVLHPKTPFLAPLNAGVAFSSVAAANGSISTFSGSFPQYGMDSLPGLHFRLENPRLLAQEGSREKDSVLLAVVFKDSESWGEGRSVEDFFKLVNSFDYPKAKISIAMLTSSMSEFSHAKALFQRHIQQFARLSVLFRNDFSQQGQVFAREDRHDDELQTNRRRILARYRNFALLSTLETWHQHVVWLDADVHVVPADLMKRMIHCKHIVEPMCVRMKEAGTGWYEYDLNAWVGRRKMRRALDNPDSFVPGDLSVKRMKQFHGGLQTFVPLDSVGGTMLYVNAEVHRQGVLFPVHYLIGNEWTGEGYDGIETEGLCYAAHFLGFKCWGMPNDLIYHI